MHTGDTEPIAPSTPTLDDRRNSTTALRIDTATAPRASKAWQVSRARQLIGPKGDVIVAEYFDIGHTRALPWQRCPKASELLAVLRDPNRGFDAVVIGEPQRAFYGNQFSLTLWPPATSAGCAGTPPTPGSSPSSPP
jgi:hypothetical protein